jgi:hypothetical protein
MNNQTFTPSTDPEERPKKSYKFLFIAAAFLFVLSLVLIFSDSRKDGSKNPPGGGTPSGAALDSLLFAQLPGALAERGLDSLKLDDITFNEVKDQAVLWLAASDADTGELLAREPEAILALWNKESGQWNLYQKDDEIFLDMLKQSDFRIRRFTRASQKPTPGLHHRHGLRRFQAALARRADQTLTPGRWGIIPAPIITAATPLTLLTALCSKLPRQNPVMCTTLKTAATTATPPAPTASPFKTAHHPLHLPYLFAHRQRQRAG